MNINSSDSSHLKNGDLKSRSIEMRQWQHYIETEIGFTLPDEQLRWLVNAIENTATAHKLTSLQLWERMQTHSELRQQLLDAVLIPESRFFRHIPSVHFITALAAKHQAQRSIINTESDPANEGSNDPFRIWSVGCATGQEVWSLAMSLTVQDITNYAILGTDVSQKALAKARIGRYMQRKQCLIPVEYQQFIQLVNEQSYKRTDLEMRSDLNVSAPDKVVFTYGTNEYQVVPKLRKRVHFIWHNIFTQEPATEHLQQIIICQNVLIYFRQFDQRDILTRLAAQCELGGHIILAPGEALFWRPSNMRRVIHSQVNAWQKISA